MSILWLCFSAKLTCRPWWQPSSLTAFPRHKWKDRALGDRESCSSIWWCVTEFLMFGPQEEFFCFQQQNLKFCYFKFIPPIFVSDKDVFVTTKHPSGSGMSGCDVSRLWDVDSPWWWMTPHQKAFHWNFREWGLCRLGMTTEVGYLVSWMSPCWQRHTNLWRDNARCFGQMERSANGGFVFLF